MPIAFSGKPSPRSADAVVVGEFWMIILELEQNLASAIEIYALAKEDPTASQEEKDDAAKRRKGMMLDQRIRAFLPMLSETDRDDLGPKLERLKVLRNAVAHGTTTIECSNLPSTSPYDDAWDDWEPEYSIEFFHKEARYFISDVREGTRIASELEDQVRTMLWRAYNCQSMGSSTCSAEGWCIRCMASGSG